MEEAKENLKRKIVAKQHYGRDAGFFEQNEGAATLYGLWTGEQ